MCLPIPTILQCFRLGFQSYNWPLWLNCRLRRDISSSCDQRCPNWQRRRLRLALQLVAGTTTSAQKAKNGHKRQVRDTIGHFAFCICCLVGLCACYGHTEWCSLRTMVNPVVILLPSSLAFHHDIYWMYAQFSRSSKFCLVCSSILHSVDTSHISVIPLCFLCVLPLLLSPFCSVCSLRGWLWWTIRTVPIHSYNSFIGLVL